MTEGMEGAPVGVGIVALAENILSFDQAPKLPLDRAAKDALISAEGQAVGNFVGSEHILLGLMAAEGSTAARALAYFRVEPVAVRSRVEQIIGVPGGESSQEPVRFTPMARKVLELAYREAIFLEHHCIGTEHLLLAMLRSNEHIAGQILDELLEENERVSLGSVRTWLLGQAGFRES
jgi:ATP-dependent Clp protease ATP-binding subunit ClpA